MGIVLVMIAMVPVLWCAIEDFKDFAGMDLPGARVAA